MSFNLLSLSKDFNTFWCLLVSENSQVRCDCDKKYSRDQDSSGNRRIRCRPCSKNFSVVNFIRTFIIPNSTYDEMFNSVSKNYKENYSKYFDVIEVKSNKINIPKLQVNKRMTSNIEKGQILLKLIDDDNHIDKSTSIQENVLQVMSTIKRAKYNNVDLEASTSNTKYNYEFKGNSDFVKKKYTPVYLYGIEFKDSKQFMQFIADKSSYKHMVKTCLLIGSKLVEVQIISNECKSFLASMVNIPEFDFVTTHIDRVYRELSKNCSEFGAQRRTEVNKGYSMSKNEYLHKFLY